MKRPDLARTLTIREVRALSITLQKLIARLAAAQRPASEQPSPEATRQS